MRSVATVRALALLASCHALLSRIVPTWRRLLQGKPLEEISLTSEMRDGVWDENSDGDDDKARTVGPNASPGDWEEFN